MRKDNTLAFYKFDYVQEKTQPTRLLNMPVMRSIEQSNRPEMKKVMTIAVMRKVVLSDVEKLMIGSVDNTTSLLCRLGERVATRI